MTDYLTSSEALEKLCETQPDLSKEYDVLKKTMVGLGTGFVAVVLGDACMMSIEGFGSIDSVLYTGMDCFSIVASGALSLGFGAVSLYALSDGVTALGKSSGLYNREGFTYYMNKGFTKKPSLFDKILATKVVPVETVNELNLLNLNKEDYVLLNKILVKSTEIKSKTILPNNTVIKTTDSQTHTKYTTKLQGELKGIPLTISTVTEDHNLAECLANKKKGSKIYTMGTLGEDGTIDLKQFGDALIR